MKLFTCQKCMQALYFENTFCEKCGSQVGFLPKFDKMSVVTAAGSAWIASADTTRHYRFCANWESEACNWLVETEGAGAAAFCEACSHNAIIPDVSDPLRHAQWVRLEVAKRRLIYSLLKLRLPLPKLGSDDPQPLQFVFLAETPTAKPMTGHENGIITIALNEADDASREAMRASVHEPYRTLLGHMRHEVGHFYWDRLVRDRHRIDDFRSVFGDESQSYDEALQRYYRDGPIPDWGLAHISAYASMHPWEDFAETWAHYLHIVDTLEMADAFGLSVSPKQAALPNVEAGDASEPHTIGDIQALLNAWMPLVFAVNSLNRSMGQPDLYPFVVSPPVIEKLEFVRKLIRDNMGA